MTELFGINPIDGGAIALLVIVFLSVLTGRLVPRTVLKDTQVERDYWRDAHSEEVKARQAERGLTNELLEVAPTADHVFASIPRPPNPTREEVTAGDAMDQTPGRT